MIKGKIGIVIQARLTSNRFPRKSLALLLGKPIIQWVVERAQMVSPEIGVIVVIPENKENDELNEFLKTLNVNIVRGSENNVASRFVSAIEKFELDHVIRVCADNPLLSPRYIRFLIDFYFQNNERYSFNHMPRFGLNINDGFGAEIFQARKFMNDYKSFTKNEEFEHVTFKFTQNCTPGDCAFQEWMKGDLKLDVDTPEDLLHVEQSLIKLINSTDKRMKHVNVDAYFK